MLTVAEASASIRATLVPLPGELLPLTQAEGRVLATDIVCEQPLPPFDSSAMDGFAVRATDTPGTLPVVASAAAAPGTPAPLPQRAALRIMTGAPLPPGADAVVMREEADDRGADVRLPAARAEQNVRRAGEDLRPGDLALRAGTTLGAGELGLLAGLGVTSLMVAQRPRVAILATGSELVPVGTRPGPGQIVNSSALALAAQVREAGGIPVDAGIVSDDETALAERIAGALNGADLLITTGGVSVGDYDLVKKALAQAGVTIELWKVAMKPGKPLVFGRDPRGVPCFGLPGNPVSSYIAFELFVRPALRLLQGARRIDRPRASARLATDHVKAAGRSHYLRARLERQGNHMVAHLHPRQGSATLSSLVELDALVELAAEIERVRAGDAVPVLLLAAV